MVKNHAREQSSAFGRRSLLAGSGALALGIPRRPAEAQTSGLVVIGKEGWLFPLWDVMSRFDERQQHEVTQVLGEATAILRRGGIELVMVMAPAKSRAYRQYLPNTVRLADNIDRRYPAAATELSRAGALVPDLDTAFRGIRISQPNQPLYFKTDTHWTAVGSAIAAVEVAGAMKQNLRLPPSSKPGEGLAPPVMEVNPMGDLVGLLPRAERSKYSAETFAVRRAVEASDAGALVEDDTADVVVIGNSFVQPRYAFQTILSNQLGRPVGLAWRPNNFGAYFTMLEYLKSELFRRQRPKALVWVHLEFDMQNMANSSSLGQNAMPPQTFLSEMRRAVG